MIGVADASAPVRMNVKTRNSPPATRWTCWFDMMELTGEKADDDVQYRTGNVWRRPMLVSERDQSYNLLYFESLDQQIYVRYHVSIPVSYFVLFVH